MKLNTPLTLRIIIEKYQHFETNPYRYSTIVCKRPPVVILLRGELFLFPSEFEILVSRCGFISCVSLKDDVFISSREITIGSGGNSAFDSFCSCMFHMYWTFSLQLIPFFFGSCYSTVNLERYKSSQKIYFLKSNYCVLCFGFKDF